MLYFGIETGTPKSKYIFCTILHFPIESILVKKAYMFQKDCCNTSRNNLDCNEEILSNKVIYISQKGIALFCQTIMHVPIEANILKKACNFQKIRK
jgi:hypothetical protein